MASRNPKYNVSGCEDPTAFEALKPMIQEDAALEKKVHNLVNTVKFIFNRGTHGDSSFMLDGLPSSSEKPLPLGMGYVTQVSKTRYATISAGGGGMWSKSTSR